MNPNMTEADEAAMPEAERAHLDKWRRCWTTVVRRDMPRQHRAICAQQREALVALKRTRRYCGCGKAAVEVTVPETARRWQSWGGSLVVAR